MPLDESDFAALDRIGVALREINSNLEELVGCSDQIASALNNFEGEEPYTVLTAIDRIREQLVHHALDTAKG